MEWVSNYVQFTFCRCEKLKFRIGLKWCVIRASKLHPSLYNIPSCDVKQHADSSHQFTWYLVSKASPPSVKTITTTKSNKHWERLFPCSCNVIGQLTRKEINYFLCVQIESERESVPGSLLTSCCQWQTFRSAVTDHLAAHRFNMIQIAVSFQPSFIHVQCTLYWA